MNNITDFFISVEGIDNNSAIKLPWIGKGLSQLFSFGKWVYQVQKKDNQPVYFSLVDRTTSDDLHKISWIEKIAKVTIILTTSYIAIKRPLILVFPAVVVIANLVFRYVNDFQLTPKKDETIELKINKIEIIEEKKNDKIKLFTKDNFHPIFKEVNSSQLKKIELKSSCELKEDPRVAFLTAEEDNPGAPILSISDWIPKNIYTHLMRNKAKVRLGTKYKSGDSITNMEGVLHTFVNPLGLIRMTGDYFFGNGTHQMNLFEVNEVREVILSARIHPDFETDEVMWRLICCRKEAVEGKPLDENFVIPTLLQKADNIFRRDYDKKLAGHLVYRLMSSHTLPAYSEIQENQKIISIENAIQFLNSLIKNKSTTEEVLKEIENKFLSHNEKLISMEMLFRTYLEQNINEFSILEKTAPQGYIYTFNPPSIFAQTFNATLLNRFNILSLKYLHLNKQFNNLKVYAFDDYSDKEAIGLLQLALKDISVCNVKSLFPDNRYKEPEEGQSLPLVIHNNSDGFGDNITNEGPGGSLDGTIGYYSDAASVFRMDREDLFHCVYHNELNTKDVIEKNKENSKEIEYYLKHLCPDKFGPQVTKEQIEAFLNRGGEIEVLGDNESIELPQEGRYITGCASGINRSQALRVHLKNNGCYVDTVLAGGDSAFNPQAGYHAPSSPKTIPMKNDNFKQCFNQDKIPPLNGNFPEYITLIDHKDCKNHSVDTCSLYAEQGMIEINEDHRKFYQDYIDHLQPTHILGFSATPASALLRLIKRQPGKNEQDLKGFKITVIPWGDTIGHPEGEIEPYSLEAHQLFKEKLEKRIKIKKNE